MSESVHRNLYIEATYKATTHRGYCVIDLIKVLYDLIPIIFGKSVLDDRLIEHM